MRAARATSRPHGATAPPSSSPPTSRRTRSPIARELVEAAPGTRVGVGRPASGSGLGRSLLEARAALDAVAGPVASYQDLGSLELLLSLPGAALEAFVDRVLGPASANAWLLESLAALLDTGCRWSDAADRLGIHRHTLRYRMDQLRKQTGRHPDDPPSAWSSGSPSRPSRRSQRGRRSRRPSEAAPGSRIVVRMTRQLCG